MSSGSGSIAFGKSNDQSFASSVFVRMIVSGRSFSNLGGSLGFVMMTLNACLTGERSGKLASETWSEKICVPTNYVVKALIEILNCSDHGFEGFMIKMNDFAPIKV